MNDLMADAFITAGRLVTAVHGLFAPGDLPASGPIAGGPGQAPPSPPPPSPGHGSGGLSDGEQGAGQDHHANTGAAAQVDDKLTDMVGQALAANQQAREQVMSILGQIEAKQDQLGPELGDPASVTLYQVFTDAKFAEIQKILEDSKIGAKEQAAIFAALAEEYRTTPPASDTDRAARREGGDDSAGTGGDPATPGGAPVGVEAAAAEPGGEPVTGGDPLVDPLAGLGPIGGAGVDPLSAMMPALAGMGSLPGALGGLGGGPMGALGSALGPLGQLGGLAAGGFSDRPADEPAADAEFTDEDADKPPEEKDTAGEGFTDEDAPAPPAAPSPAVPAAFSPDDPAAAPGAPAPGDAVPASAPAPDAPATGARQVSMPDGSIIAAPDDRSAAAMRAVLSGSGVTEAFKSVGVDLPPPGTPVTAPVDPSRLEPGHLGHFESREPVVAMGNGKIWMEGQLQPIGALGSTSDFLGWSKAPTAGAASTAPAPAAGDAPPPAAT